MKRGDIVIRDKSRATEIKYRLTRINKIGDIVLLWGYRVKYNKKGEWVTFGNEHAILGRDYRLLIEDDYRYIK